MNPALRQRLTSPRGLVTTAGALVLLALVVLGPMIWGDRATTTAVADRLAGPGAGHLFGTDELGRDILARTLVATRTSVLIALGATAISVLGGVLLGLAATVLPRPVRRLLAGLIDILLAFPWLLLALFFSAIWGAGTVSAMLAVGFAGIPTFARLGHTLAASVMGRDYIRAAQISGLGPVSIVARHVVPNILPPLTVNATVMAASALLSFAGLSFLGLGVQPPSYDWGRLFQEGFARIYVNPVAALGPGLAIVLTCLVFTQLGELYNQSGRRPSIVRRKAGAPPATQDGGPVAQIEDLHVAFPDASGRLVERVRGVSFSIQAGETIGIVGESGSGKSVTSMALAGLLDPTASVTARTLTFRGIDMTAPLTRTSRGVLGTELAMVFQDPLTSLNPSLTVGRQLTEVAQVHGGASRAQARDRAVTALTSVGIPEPERRVKQLPHELSGGMRQRVMIGMGLMARPKLLLADEPTTALDVTVQRQVLSVLRRTQRRSGAAILLVSHDIALISGFCDRILVMRNGEVVETLAAADLHEARHPYTRALIACVPDMTSDRSRPLPVIGDELPEEVPS
ncbi:dipeptide/oligopeptide/nickel ABC transporter permease/ATP-binding protein [Kineosporia mesophila]|uniref:Dipeptide/oligopeptide/nickel ABC transporter permease/ATP-binding protein n=1 Tax=Kineosporia mesophila TaxID=566012 RepID=A0ABP7AES2_9ACTN|nr:dipeptide/oligopeptide/nickel ABC transporter permease/ATP-binding protein [Kineosporia mesophila]MCD5352873.1 dipeptide/oligopeptide/nickel ABC transporter permease/ATP-binding protein [Kineosporia mesophila]